MAIGICVIQFMFCLSVFGNIAKVEAESTDTEEQPEPRRVYRWRQYDYTGKESVDMSSVEDAFHPIVLTSEVHGDSVMLTMTYTERITSTPYWDFKFDGVSYMITQGHIERKGSQISSTINLPVSWNSNQFLGFSITSNIGTYFIELDYDFLRNNWVGMSVPRIGFKMEVPEEFESDEFLVKVERSAEVINETCFDFFFSNGVLRYVVNGKVERISAVARYSKEKKPDQYEIQGYGIFVDYIHLESEVVLFSYCRILDNFLDYFKTFGIFKDIKFVKYTRRNRAGINADNVNITFVDGIYGAEDVMNFDDTFSYRFVSCEAFGSTKPVITIQNEAGELLPTVELKPSSGVTSHVIASLENIPLNQAVGKYICKATAGSKTISKTIKVKKVIRPEILVAEVIVNNTEEIIAICVARGQPAPDISFSVNFAKDDFIENRPVLETERTVTYTHTSKYKRTGGLGIDSWFENKAERCPTPDYFEVKKETYDSDVTQKMIALKPLPYLSRQQVNLLYCRADGNDNVYVTKDVTAKMSEVLNSFMTAVSSLSFVKAFG